MKTTASKTKRERGHCHICGAAVSLLESWFGEKVVEFHGQIGHGVKGSGIRGRCAGSRLPPSEVGQERIASYIDQNNARVASYSQSAATTGADRTPKLPTIKRAIVTALSKCATASTANDIAINIARPGSVGFVARACDELVEAGILALGAPVGGACAGRVRTYKMVA